jgi:hypothetical protein
VNAGSQISLDDRTSAHERRTARFETRGGVARWARRAGVSMVVHAMIALILAYQMLIRPLLLGSCRFHPSCSHYAIEALRRHGPWRGGGMALNRIIRCRPGGGCGPDPVP